MQPPELSDALVVRTQTSEQPHQPGVALTLHLQPAGGTDLLQISVQVKLEQVPRIIAGAPSFGRLSTLESQSRHVQPTNKGVNHAANMILTNQLIQRHRKQRPLTPTFSLNESHEQCPRSREGIFSFVYQIGRASCRESGE